MSEHTPTYMELIDGLAPQTPIDLTNAEHREILRLLAEDATPEAVAIGLWGAETPDELYAFFRESIEYGIQEGRGHQPYIVVAQESLEEGVAPQIACITGNGPKSEARARLYVLARPILLSMLDLLDILEEGGVLHEVQKVLQGEQPPQAPITTSCLEPCDLGKDCGCYPAGG